jgi:hypothetical protein
MSSHHVRKHANIQLQYMDTMKAISTTSVAKDIKQFPYIDSENVLTKPVDPYWFTAEFTVEESGFSQFGEYVPDPRLTGPNDSGRRVFRKATFEKGKISLVFNCRSGSGDDIFEACEAIAEEFFWMIDPAKSIPAWSASTSYLERDVVYYSGDGNWYMAAQDTDNTYTPFGGSAPVTITPVTETSVSTGYFTKHWTRTSADPRIFYTDMSSPEVYNKDATSQRHFQVIIDVSYYFAKGA